VALCFPALVTGLPANHGRWLFPPHLWQAFPAGSPSFKGRIVGGCSYRASAFLWARRIYSSSRYITGTIYIAIGVPFSHLFISSNLRP
jgi:hypothetical protein